MKTVRSCLAIVCSLLLVFSLTAATANIAGTEPSRFSADDMAVDDLKYGASKDEAEMKFGTPPNIEDQKDEKTGETREIWKYEGMTLTFSSDGELVGAEVSVKGHKGPHGVEVGKLPQEIVLLFYLSPNTVSSRQFYWNESMGAFNADQPPCAYSESYGDGRFAFRYLAYADPSRDNVMVNETGVYTKEGYAHLAIKFDQDGVTSFKWYVSPYTK